MLLDMWDLPRPGIEPVFPPLQHRGNPRSVSCGLHVQFFGILLVAHVGSPWHPRPHHSLLSYALVIHTVVPVQLKVSHTAGKTLFLSESGRVLLEEVSVSIRGLRTVGETVVSDTD